MRITAIETIRLARGVTVHAGPIRWLWVRIHTDAGLVGLGETYPHPEAESAIVHHALDLSRPHGGKLEMPTVEG